MIGPPGELVRTKEDVMRAMRQSIILEKPIGIAVTTLMGLSELKRVVDTLTMEDRLELSEYLRQTSKLNDPQWQAEIGRRLDACLQGKGHRAQELLALHDRLAGEGR